MRKPWSSLRQWQSWAPDSNNLQLVHRSEKESKEAHLRDPQVSFSSAHCCLLKGKRTEKQGLRGRHALPANFNVMGCKLNCANFVNLWRPKTQETSRDFKQLDACRSVCSNNSWNQHTIESLVEHEEATTWKQQRVSDTLGSDNEQVTV